MGLAKRAIRWSWLLPITALVLTVALSVVGKLQTEKRLAGSEHVWDYVAPAETILHSINYPAAVAAGLLTRNHNFRIGLEYSAITFSVYVGLVVLLWLMVGRSIDARPQEAISARPRALLAALAAIYGLLLLLVAVAMLNGPHAVLLLCAAFIWSGVVLLLASRSLIKRFRRGSDLVA